MPKKTSIDYDKIFRNNRNPIKYLKRVSEEQTIDIDWIYISANYLLSDKFLEAFKDKIKWRTLARFNYLSERTIKKFENYLDWGIISRVQKISIKFIIENIKKIDIELLRKNHNLDNITKKLVEL